jgi:hypothetical protein
MLFPLNLAGFSKAALANAPMSLADKKWSFLKSDGKIETIRPWGFSSG